MNKSPHPYIKGGLLGLILLTPFFLLFVVQAETPIDIENNRKKNARIFCAQGRQWIEFANGSATWGAPVLDYDGKPVRCNTVLEQRVTKG